MLAAKRIAVFNDWASALKLKVTAATKVLSNIFI